MQKVLQTELFQFYRTEPDDWEKIKKGVIGVENSAFEVGVRENEAEIAKDFKSEKGVCLVVYGNKGRVVAYASGAPIEDDKDCSFDGDYGLGITFYIDSIAVLPKFQNRGIGSLLTKLQFSEVQKMGYRRITAHATDERFERIFEKMGANKVRYFTKWVDSRDAWYMERTII